MSEWVTQPLAGAPTALFKGNRYRAGGLRTGASAAHILVFNRWVGGWMGERASERVLQPVHSLQLPVGSPGWRTGVRHTTSSTQG